MKEDCRNSFCETASLRLAVMGASGVGKSALTVRFLTKRFIGEYERNVEYTYRRETDLADTIVTYELRDASAKSCLREPEAYAAWATSIIVVYSITDRSSFVAAAALLQDIFLLNKCTSRRQIFLPSVTLIGNKSDLEYRRQIKLEEGEKLAEQFSAAFYEVSASKDFENIFYSFKRILTVSYQTITNNNEDNHVENCVNEEDLYSPDLTEGEDPKPAPKRITRKERMRKRAERKHSVKRRLSAVIFKRKSDTPVD